MQSLSKNEIFFEKFRVSFETKKASFNEKCLLDDMYIENLHVLRIVEESTGFSAGRFLPCAGTKQIWDTFVEFWYLIDSTIPNKILIDQRTSFREAFAVYKRLWNVNVSHMGIESHSALVIGESYHQPLRITYQNISITHSHIPKGLRLTISVKALNDTLGAQGIVISLLLYKTSPQIRVLRIGLLQHPKLAKRAKAAETARAEM